MPHKSLLIVFIATVSLGQAFPQLVTVDAFSPRRADTVILERNWRTRDRIILAELAFEPGDTVTRETLALSLKKIWNLQNFASVEYRWDSLPGGKSALILTVRDALTIIPVLGGRLQMPDMTLTTGIADRNFLGRNIRVELRGQFSSREPLFGEVRATIPRQLLWKNMSVGAGFRREDLRFAPIISDQAFISIVNPFHQDYQYTFSPDAETGFLRHRSMDDAPETFSRSFWYLRISESVGTITHRRHQEEGFQLAGSIGTAIGLNSETGNYLEGSILAEYHTLIKPRLQFSLHWEGHYTSTGYESLWTRYGPGNIRGISYGDLTGPLIQLASAGFCYTWLNRDYLAVEQSVFAQYASAVTTPGDWSGISRHYAIGTGFQFTVPMYPAASLLITFSFNPRRDNWFYLEL